MSASPDKRRPRARSMLSFSGKRSSLLFGTGDIVETHEEKEAHEVKTKANPNKAMNEIQPAAWAFEPSTIVPLRSMEHKDVHGNPIADPDASNPTRSRFERPLDTIRSFEAAIDNSYRRRPMSRADQSGTQGPRHGSYQGLGYPQRSPVDDAGNYGRGASTRPRSYADNNGYMPNQLNHSRRIGQGNRVASDPVLHSQNSHSVYPSHGNQQSYDTVASASAHGSGATDPWGNSTDPSSENSSIDRVQPPPKPDIGEQYGFSGFGGAPQYQGPILEEHGSGSPAYGQPGYGQSHVTSGGGYPFQGNPIAPPPPAHGSRGQIAPRVPIKLGGSAPAIDSSSPTTSSPERRKSWLKRRFSKGSRG